MYNSRFQSVRLLDNQVILKVFKQLMDQSILMVDPSNIANSNLTILNTLYINGMVSKRKIQNTIYFRIKPIAVEVYKLYIKDKEISWVARSVVIGVTSFLIYALACLNFVIYPPLSYSLLFLLVTLDITLLITAIKPMVMSAKYQVHASRSIMFILGSISIVIFFSLITIF